MKSTPEAQFCLLDPDAAQHHESVRRVVDLIQRTNEAVRQAVDAGMAIELVRSSRYHNNGTWGDQIAPAVCEQQKPLNA